MNNVTLVLVLSIVCVLICILSNLIMWRKLRLEQIRFRLKISQAEQELQSDLELVEETELIQTESGRELLIFRLTEDIINPHARVFVIRSIVSDFFMKELFNSKDKSPDEKLKVLKETIVKLAASAPTRSTAEILAQLSSMRPHIGWSLLKNPNENPVRKP